MKKKLIKNMVTFALMCTIVVSLCVALYAAGTSPYFGEIMVATLDANNGFLHDSFSAYTRDDLNVHNCSLSFDIEPKYDPLIRMYVICYMDIGDTDDDGDTDYELQTYSCREKKSSYTISDTFSLGRKLDHVLSEHRLNLYCEGRSEVYTLSDVAD